MPLNIPTFTGNERIHVDNLLNNPGLLNEGKYTQLCTEWFESEYGKPVLLTKSCTHSLELSALLLDIQPGDEVILPSYAFVSAANAFVLRGAIPVFTDVRREDMNLDPNLIEAAITPKTKAIVVVHYAGVSCDMEAMQALTQKHGLYLVEDAAQGIMAKYQGKYLGTMGDLGCISFDQMKNLTCIQGGLLILNDDRFIDRADILFENGTNKKQFLAGKSNFYHWVDLGSNFKLSEIQAAYLYGQLEKALEITQKRLSDWNFYFHRLKPLAEKFGFNLPQIPSDTHHNAHIFYLKMQNKAQRDAFSEFFRRKGALATFHYVPLHDTEFGLKTSRFHGSDQHTQLESQRLVRLPLYYSIQNHEIEHICNLVGKFFLDQVHPNEV
ncbi:MAG: dTDP-4-amino-4,6-dideoxygalactose transaminase [Bacteroidia bacterium]|nr:dTDP-4-amino-4,6-dideoxygalactose transaminase [Bacteroidia bacterium]